MEMEERVKRVRALEFHQLDPPEEKQHGLERKEPGFSEEQNVQNEGISLLLRIFYTKTSLELPLCSDTQPGLEF